MPFGMCTFVGQAEMKPVSRLPGEGFWPGRVGSRVSVSDPVFDLVLSFTVRVYYGVVSI